MDNNQNNRLSLFLEDSREQLDRVEQYLVQIDTTQPTPETSINEIFRAIHTIKGGADFLGLDVLKTITHRTEDVLDLARKQELVLDTTVISILLEVTDLLKAILQDPENASIDTDHIVAALNTILEQDSAAETIEEPVQTEPHVTFEEPVAENIAPKDRFEYFNLDETAITEWEAQGFCIYICQVAEEVREELTARIEEIGYLIEEEQINNHQETLVLFRSVLSKSLTVRYLGVEPDNLSRRLDRNSGEEKTAERTLQAVRSPAGDIPAPQPEVPEATETQKVQTVEEEPDSEKAYVMNATNNQEDSTALNSIRVNVNLLDNLMNLAGELVLTRNQLNQNVEHWDENAINLAAQRLDTVTSELQESIMSTRMQPISIVLSRFHRLTRDVSHKLGKSVNLVLEGEEVELDKSIIENIGDPLTHLVRNAIDHGIESPEKRRQAGKNETGTIAIKARHEAGHVVIDVIDDGNGIDSQKILAEALRKGIVDRTRADEMSERELLRLIFTPGFSTATELTDLSGRGVGMDVVSTNLSRIGGTIDIDTQPGKGTQIKIKLPLTLAIVPSLLVSVSEENFAIPQVNLVELVRLSPEQSQKIEYVGDAAVMRLRGKLLPVIWLKDFLNSGDEASVPGSDTSNVIPLRREAESESGDSPGQEFTETLNVVVVAAGDFHYGIIVDALTDSEEIVVKPLGAHLRNCRGYAGATILGDGRASLILDVPGICDACQLQQQAEIANTADDLMRKAESGSGDEEKLLVLQNAESEYFGVQLAFIKRIERIRSSQIQRVGNKRVVKYGSSVIRVFELNEAIETGSREESDHAYLVIFPIGGQEVAIAVSNLVDIVEAPEAVDSSTFRQPGVQGSAIISEQITLLIDLFAIVRAIDPDLGDYAPAAKTSDSAESILVVEDSVFFQDKLSELLSGMGYDVMIAEDGQAGWETLDTNASAFDLVLMDIEMPRMDGLQLTKKLRSDNRFDELPVIMLTSLAKESDIERGKDAGADEYLVKMDEEMVRKSVLRLLDQSHQAVA